MSATTRLPSEELRESLTFVNGSLILLAIYPNKSTTQIKQLSELQARQINLLNAIRILKENNL